MRTGIFVGSFDPFTLGHFSIVRRALPLFDKLVIGVGVNERKSYMLTTEQRIETIKRLFADEPTVEVKSYNGLTVDFAHSVGAQFIVKGVRSMKDFEYEREQADINRQIGDVETVLLFSEPQLAHISSSMVQELIHFGKDPAPFLPDTSQLPTPQDK